MSCAPTAQAGLRHRRTSRGREFFNLISVLSANLLFASRGKTGLALCMDPPCVARENVRLRTPQAMRVILLASAIPSLNRLSRRAAASIQDLRPCFPLPEVGDAPRHTAYDARSNAKH